MKITKVLTIFFIILFSFYSCTNQINNTISEIKNIKPIKTGKVLFGKAVFPASRKEIASFKTKSFNTKSLSVSNFKTKGFKIKAVPSDISSVSTISVIIPSDSPTTPNKTIATGITDILGNFQIDMSAITLANNSIYVLEASKRTGKDIETIRTFIKWNGTAWESITTGDALINETTTSVSIIAGLTNIPSINLISKIDPANVFDIKDSTNTNVLITKSDITKVAGLVNSVLLGERDPIALIKYDLTKPYKFFVDQTYNFANITLENGCTGCSFIGANFSTSGANLSGKDLSYSDLSGQDLSTADLSGTILIGADLTGATLPPDMSYLNLESVILKNQDFTQKTLTGTNFHNADLTGAIFTSQDLTKTRLSGTNLTNSDLSSANFTKCYLFETVFENNIIKNAKFEKADLTGANFSTVQGSDFSGVSFKDAILIGSNFSAVNLTNVDLITANVQGSDFSKATVNNKKMGKKLQNCNFSEAILIGENPDIKLSTDFTDIDYSSSNFTKTKLKNIYFNNIDCSNCDFTETELDNVIFDNSNLDSILFEKNVIKTKTFEINASNLRKSSFKNILTPSSTIGISIKAKDFSYAEVNNLKTDDEISNIEFEKADYTKIVDSEIIKIRQNTKAQNDFIIFRNEYNSSHKKGQITQTEFNLFQNPLNHLNGFIGDDIFPATFDYSNNKFFKFDYLNSIYSNEYINKNLTAYDIPPVESIKGFSIKNSYVLEFNGYFTDSNFSFYTKDSTKIIKLNYSYFKNCDFTIKNNSAIFSRYSYFLNSNTLENTTFDTIFDTYIKDSIIKTKEIHLSFLVNSHITGSSNQIVSSFSGYNSSIDNGTCKKTWTYSYPIYNLQENGTVIITGYSSSTQSFFYDFCLSAQ